MEELLTDLMAEVRDSKAHAVHSMSSLTTDIVVDLGCIGWLAPDRRSMEDSISLLVKRFQPAVLYGFDPHPGLQEGIGKAFGTVVMTSQRAAWTFDGQVALELQGNCTHVTEGLRTDVGCFDLARWILELPKAELVMKMDVEGAEYVLLPHLIEQGAMERVARLLIEWHTGRYANGLESDRDEILDLIDCPVEEWL